MKINELKNNTIQASRILGVDASTKFIAFTVLVEGEVEDFDKISIEGADVPALCAFAYKIGSVLRDEADPDLMVVEQAVFVNNRQVVIKLANVFGAFMAAFDGVPVEQVAPVTWMSHIGNNIRVSKTEVADLKKERPGMSKSWYRNEIRKMRKQETIDILSAKYGVELSDDDIADSMGVATYGFEVLAKGK